MQVTGARPRVDAREARRTGERVGPERPRIPSEAQPGFAIREGAARWSTSGISTGVWHGCWRPPRSRRRPGRRSPNHRPAPRGRRPRTRDGRPIPSSLPILSSSARRPTTTHCSRRSSFRIWRSASTPFEARGGRRRAGRRGRIRPVDHRVGADPGAGARRLRVAEGRDGDHDRRGRSDLGADPAGRSAADRCARRPARPGAPHVRRGPVAGRAARPGRASHRGRPAVSLDDQAGAPPSRWPSRRPRAPPSIWISTADSPT